MFLYKIHPSFPFAFPFLSQLPASPHLASALRAKTSHRAPIAAPPLRVAQLPAGQASDKLAADTPAWCTVAAIARHRVLTHTASQRRLPPMVPPPVVRTAAGSVAAGAACRRVLV